MKRLLTYTLIFIIAVAGCTYVPEPSLQQELDLSDEQEQAVEYILQQCGIEEIDKIARDSALDGTHAQGETCYRLTSGDAENIMLYLSAAKTVNAVEWNGQQLYVNGKFLKTLTQSAQDNVIPPEIKAGTVLKKSKFDITITSVSFSDDVVPKNKPILYTHYSADPGNVYIDVSYQIKNTQKQDLDCDHLLSITADYNHGYTYTGFAVAEDPHSGFSNLSSIFFNETLAPLESKEFRYIIECPQEVVQTDYPLHLIVRLEGKEYQYIIRT